MKKLLTSFSLLLHWNINNICNTKQLWISNYFHNRICAGCNAEIGYGRYLNCLGAFWHPECFRCRACNLPISDYEVQEFPLTHHIAHFNVLITGFYYVLKVLLVLHVNILAFVVFHIWKLPLP
jgi:hypothetical protein